MMKRTVLALVTLVMAPVVLGAQPAPDSVADSLIAIEKAAWEAWINHDVAFFEDYLAEEALLLHPNGRFDRSQQLEDVARHPCEVSDYSLADFTVMKLADDVRLLTYESWADVTCAGEAQPPRTLSTVVFVRRHGSWLNVLYQETPLAE